MKLRVFILILIVSTVLWAAIPQTAITIQVKNTHDKPVDNAEVILDFVGPHHQVFKLGRRALRHWEMRTNQEGTAKFPPIPQGTIQVQVVGKDYQTFGKRFDVDDPEKTIDVTLNPPQKQYSNYPPLSPKQ